MDVIFRLAVFTVIVRTFCIRCMMLVLFNIKYLCYSEHWYWAGVNNSELSGVVRDGSIVCCLFLFGRAEKGLASRLRAATRGVTASI